MVQTYHPPPSPESFSSSPSPEDSWGEIMAKVSLASNINHRDGGLIRGISTNGTTGAVQTSSPLCFAPHKVIAYFTFSSCSEGEEFGPVLGRSIESALLTAGCICASSDQSEENWGFSEATPSH